MYDVIRTKNVTVDFCPQMTLHDIPKMSQIGVKEIRSKEIQWLHQC